MDLNSKIQLDLDYFEFIIAYNCTIEETYLATIIDNFKLKYITNQHVKSYLNILFEFYNKRGSVPTPAEIISYLSTDELKKSYKNVVLEFKNISEPLNKEELLTNTEQYLRERAVYFAVKETVNEITNQGKIQTTDIFNKFETACNISLVDNLGFDYFNEIDRHIHEITQIDNYISTGYKWLDKMLGGGWLESGRALYNFVGGTNSGKSIFLGNFTANIVKQDLVVVLITLEMSEMIYGKRISSALTDIPFASLKNDTDLLRSSLLDIKGQIPAGRLIIKEFPPNSVTTTQIKAYLKKLKQQKKIKIAAVVLDYLTLLLSKKNESTMYEAGKDTAEQLRALSYPLNFGCPFITAGQLNRGGIGEENPKLDTTGESMGISHTGDFQAAVWSTDADKELGIIKLGLQKSRFGPNFGQQAFKIDYDTLKVSELEDVFINTSTLTDISSKLAILNT